MNPTAFEEIGMRYRPARVLGAAVPAGLAAAVLEMIPTLLIQGLWLGVGPVRIFQSIASGLLGKAAYSGGLETMTLGILLHTFISIGAAAVFGVGLIIRPGLLLRPVLSGSIFGALAFVVMSYIVVPLSAAAFKPAHNPALIAVSLAVHMAAFGLPIALTYRTMLARHGEAARLSISPST